MSVFYTQLCCGQEKQVWRANVAFISAETSASVTGSTGFVTAKLSTCRVTTQRRNGPDEKSRWFCAVKTIRPNYIHVKNLSTCLAIQNDVNVLLSWALCLVTSCHGNYSPASAPPCEPSTSRSGRCAIVGCTRPSFSNKDDTRLNRVLISASGQAQRDPPVTRKTKANWGIHRSWYKGS